jgi:outer membrane lipoprotein-sorting protein
MKFFILSLLICLQTSVSFAQTTTHTTEYLNDPRAKFILDKVSRTMKKDTTKTSTFTVIVKKANGKTDSVRGEMILKGFKYKIVLHTTGPREEYYDDGKTTAVYLQKEDEVTFDTVPDPAVMNRNKNAFSAYNLFTIYETRFHYHFMKEDTLNGRIIQHIDLYPLKPGNVNFHLLHLSIDKEKKRIVRITCFYKDGAEITYIIDSYTPNLVIPDSNFQFNPLKIRGDLRKDD